MRTLGVVLEEDLPFDVQALLEEREAARREKNWLRADELRVALNMKGYLVEDSQNGIRITKI
jgi:cysteinyl-tRNA synthetase